MLVQYAIGTELLDYNPVAAHATSLSFVTPSFPTDVRGRGMCDERLRWGLESLLTPGVNWGF